jgi:hypothetical protein
VAEALGVRMVIGAVLVVPPSALLWLAAQHRGRGPAAALSAAGIVLARRLTVTLPAFRNEVAMLGGAMFLGTVVAAFISPEATARLVAALGLPPLLLSILLAWSVMALAQIGLSQLVTVTLLAGALADLGGIGIDPLVLASGLLGSWALSSCSTPVGAAILIVARMAGVSTATVAHQWNGRYVIAGALLLAVWMTGVDFALSHWQ